MLQNVSATNTMESLLEDLDRMESDASEDTRALLTEIRHKMKSAKWSTARKPTNQPRKYECARKTYPCEHGIPRNRCVPCNGSSICVHKKFKYVCRQCKELGVRGAGSAFCKHNHTKQFCSRCRNEKLGIAKPPKKDKNKRRPTAKRVDASAADESK